MGPGQAECLFVAGLVGFFLLVGHLGQSWNQTSSPAPSASSDNADPPANEPPAPADVPDPPPVESAAEKADDAAHAKEWGISLQDFKLAEDKESTAYSDCVDAIKSNARFDVKSDWAPNYTWSSNGIQITIIGHDLHLQNGFGAYSNEPYGCTWDIKSEKIVDISG